MGLYLAGFRPPPRGMSLDDTIPAPTPEGVIVGPDPTTQGPKRSLSPVLLGPRVKREDDSRGVIAFAETPARLGKFQTRRNIHERSQTLQGV